MSASLIDIGGERCDDLDARLRVVAQGARIRVSALGLEQDSRHVLAFGGCGRLQFLRVRTR